MDARTKELLEKSIEHWQDNLKKAEDGTLEMEDIKSSKCALCQEFMYKHSVNCFNCPVALDVCQTQCRGTPWPMVHAKLTDPSAIRATLPEVVQQELDFLILLLPREEEDEE